MATEGGSESAPLAVDKPPRRHLAEELKRENPRDRKRIGFALDGEREPL